ncbi:MAG TPA: hypothetical protein VEZ72_22455 [Paenibacillus sp.]|nr:hypothetical protein [Paenibacillus sp.]
MIMANSQAMVRQLFPDGERGPRWQGPLGLSPWSVDALFIVQPLALGVVAPFAGWVRDTYGARRPVAIGSAHCAASMLFVAVPQSVGALGIGLQLAFFGIGTGLFHATNNAEIMSDAPSHKISLAGRRRRRFGRAPASCSAFASCYAPPSSAWERRTTPNLGGARRGSAP